MKCEVKPILTRPSGSTQEMRGLRNQTPGIKRKQGNSFFQVSTKKATPPNHIHKRNKYTEKSSAHSSSGNLDGACNVLKCLCCIICCVQYTKALFEGTLRRNKPRKKINLLTKWLGFTPVRVLYKYSSNNFPDWTINIDIDRFLLLYCQNR